VVLLALRQHFRKSYRDFCEMLEVCTEIMDELGLRRVPHWTTLQKFSRRADARRLERLLLEYLVEARLSVLHLAVDSTGFSSTSASTYYTRVLEDRKSKIGGHRRGVQTRRYMKQTVAVETRKQLIVAVKFRRGPSNDSPDFPRVLEKVLPAGLPVRLVLADKGYDAESNHAYAQEVLGARTMIPVRYRGPGIRVGGRYRRRNLRDFDDDAYHQRAKVETVFSVEKRKMGSHVLARVSSQQHKELIFRAFSYNSGRMESLFLLFIEDFYKAARRKHLNMKSPDRSSETYAEEQERRRIPLSSWSHQILRLRGRQGAQSQPVVGCGAVHRSLGPGSYPRRPCTDLGLFSSFWQQDFEDTTP
jgi:hypothetical protein